MLLRMQSVVTCNGGYRGWLHDERVLAKQEVYDTTMMLVTAA
jgi:hypothetical protein